MLYFGSVVQEESEGKRRVRKELKERTFSCKLQNIFFCDASVKVNTKNVMQ